MLHYTCEIKIKEIKDFDRLESCNSLPVDIRTFKQILQVRLSGKIGKHHRTWHAVGLFLHPDGRGWNAEGW